ncbi:hypothetical protein Hanom_Chr08g00731411 [Helianthus anomalus]
MQNTSHFVHPVNTAPVQYGQTIVPQIQYVQAPAPQVQLQTAPQQAAQTFAPAEACQHSFFTQGFVDWSSLPEDLTDEKFSLVANSDVLPDEYCFMALKTIPEGLESEEVESRSEVVEEVAKTDVTVDIIGERMLEEKVVKPLLEPLVDPWYSSVCDGECDCAMMAATKVSPQVLKDLCSDK